RGADGKQVLEWHAEHVKALPAEQQLPPEWVYLGGVSYFAGDATAYRNELSRTMLDRAGKDARAAEMARQLAGQTKSKLETVQAIRHFLAKSIRSAGPSFTELPLSELSAADTTLSDGYGHAADRAILCYAMLKAVGCEPEFVLASGLPPITAI